jgi:hypothetical protein
MRGLVVFVEQFFWTTVWVFLVLIVGYYILGWVKGNQGNNILGSFANWVSTHAEPQ